MSSLTRASQSASTISVLVRATKPLRMPSREQISRCSRVWGMTPSSAAMTSMTKSTPAAPATMFLTKRSCPGTSTMPRRSPPGRSTQAKPSSMVMPRRFSSSRRSQSMPVRARTRDVLPWSICPAVPRMTAMIAAPAPSAPYSGLNIHRGMRHCKQGVQEQGNRIRLEFCQPAVCRDYPSKPGFSAPSASASYAAPAGATCSSASRARQFTLFS